MRFLIFTTHSFLKHKFPAQIYPCLLRTSYRNVQDEISHQAFSTECPTLNRGNTEPICYSNSLKYDFAAGTICYKNRSFTKNYLTQRRTFNRDMKICTRNITTSATINAHNTIESDNNNDSEDTPSIHTNATTQSNNSTNKSVISTSDTTDVNNAAPTTTTAGIIRCLDKDEKLKAEFYQLEKKLAAGLDRTRLSASEWLKHEAHAKAITGRHLFYECPAEARPVKTRLQHFLRGSCCGNACRHCVYEHEKVPEPLRRCRAFNSSFYVEIEPDLNEQQGTICGWGPLRQLQQADEDIKQDPLFKH